VRSSACLQQVPLNHSWRRPCEVCEAFLALEVQYDWTFGDSYSRGYYHVLIWFANIESVFRWTANFMRPESEFDALRTTVASKMILKVNDATLSQVRDNNAIMRSREKGPRTLAEMEQTWCYGFSTTALEGFEYKRSDQPVSRARGTSTKSIVMIISYFDTSLLLSAQCMKFSAHRSWW
jgi:hypothetical protein